MKDIVKQRKGISLVELLIAIVIGIIITSALTGLFVGSNRAFLKNREISELAEDVRNAITTLEFIFSRWGAGVPCENNNCTIEPTLPPCSSYPPSDPQCITIEPSSVEFYANLYGYGFVINSTGTTAKAVSCRLSLDSRQNCYLLWDNGSVRQENGNVLVYRITAISSNNKDCIKDINQSIVDLSVNGTLNNGTFISRAPHKVRIYKQGDFLFMDRYDTASSCNEDETAVRIGRVENFSVIPDGRGVFVNATFISSNGKKYSIVKRFGR